MPVARHKLLALSIVLPAVAAGAFTFATPVQADCSTHESQCCYAGQAYSLGSCIPQGCEQWSKCLQGSGHAYWQTCGC